MTLDQYMSPKWFPLTTQPGLTPRLQFMTDAVNYDQLREYLDTGATPTEEQWLRFVELDAKMAARPALLAELGAGHNGERTDVEGVEP